MEFVIKKNTFSVLYCGEPYAYTPDAYDQARQFCENWFVKMVPKGSVMFTDEDPDVEGSFLVVMQVPQEMQMAVSNFPWIFEQVHGDNWDIKLLDE